jgi:hypothetical protein
VEADVIFPAQALPQVADHFKKEKAKPNPLGTARLICTGIAGCPD